MVDRAAAARAIEDFLRALGHEPTGDLAGTGERVADAWIDDLLDGESVDAAALLRDGSILLDERGSGSASGAGHDTPRYPLDDGTGLVVVRDLAVTTVCPHHLLPAQGRALVAYMPGARIAGIGTIAHIVDVIARRLTLQERIGADVVALLMGELGARGALCKIALSHACLTARGERKTGAIVETIAVGGTFAISSPDRDLAFLALRGSG